MRWLAAGSGNTSKINFLAFISLCFLGMLVTLNACASILEGGWKTERGFVFIIKQNNWRYFENEKLIDEGSLEIDDSRLQTKSSRTGKKISYRYRIVDDELILTNEATREETFYRRIRPTITGMAKNGGMLEELGAIEGSAARNGGGSERALPPPSESENGATIGTPDLEAMPRPRAMEREAVPRAPSASMALPEDEEMVMRSMPITSANGSPDSASFAAVDEIIGRMETANIAFNTPENINLKQTAIVELILSLTQSISELTEMIEAEGAREGAAVSVSNVMEARLTGPNFGITAITPERQAISGSGLTQWKWEVKPTSAGTHRLHLTLTAIIQIEGDPTSRAIRTFDKEIFVEVTLRQKISAFVNNNWQWLWATILVPVAGWVYKKRKKAA